MQVNITNKLFIDAETSRITYLTSSNIERSVKVTQPEANIIIFLNENRGKMMSKEQLIDIGWKGRITGDNSLNVAIYNLRKHLSFDNQIQLENIPKLGYKLNVIESVIPQLKGTRNQEKNWHNKFSKLFSVNAITLKILLLLILNLFLFEFILTTYLNLVWVECRSDANGQICYSKNHSENYESIKIPQGISVISKNNYSNKAE